MGNFATGCSLTKTCSSDKCKAADGTIVLEQPCPACTTTMLEYIKYLDHIPQVPDNLLESIGTFQLLYNLIAF